MAKFRVKRGQLDALQGSSVQGSMLNAPCSSLPYAPPPTISDGEGLIKP
jgi:hypothetical protein